ncbi:MAG: 2-C-methyl-D-erythritol 2,4-cyclodiphosphate synthase, partial [Oscillospiraceae bacterium]|nr:2-C-methyl-D-erythritol 2,4-cyclodiphosphate synthase [Oscillospiraceae bacterium]
MRIGIGYDVHRLCANRKLILGGVLIPFELGLLGHSDADVLIHALMDSLLGAMCCGDIGKLFPDTDVKYKDIKSTELLKIVKEKMDEKGFEVENIDCCIVCEKPKMAPYILEMRKNISNILNIDMDQINIKATTEEG